MSTFRLAGPVLLKDDEILPATLTLAQEGVTAGKIIAIDKGIDPSADLICEGVIAPGFIDLQVNGAYGFDFTEDASLIAQVAARLPETGVTGFLPTRITSPLESYEAWLRTARESSRTNHPHQAQVFGFHLEGPYFSPQKIGAHNPAWIRPIDLDRLYGGADLSGVRVVTLAPELPNAHEAIRSLRKQGILVSAGHSNATYTEAMAGFAAGIGWGTHLFNAMRDFKHRDPALPGALLTTAIPCGLIADGIHVHPAALKLAWQAKRAPGITLVTDCMTAMGMPPGSYALGNGSVTVDATSARLADGTLSGAIATMPQCVARMVEYSGCSLAEALYMASTTPATLLGLTNKGRIAVGCDADLVLLTPELSVSHTFVMGKLVFHQ